MANDIYTTTLRGLAELVSPRVAEGVLRRALRAVATTSDEVDAATMSRLLRGRVRRDLERSLPAGGLRKSLAAIEERTMLLGDGRSPAADGSPSAGSPSATDRDGPRSGPVAPRPWRRRFAFLRSARLTGRAAPPPGPDVAPRAAAVAAPPRAVEWHHEPADDGDPAKRVRAFPIAEDVGDDVADTVRSGDDGLAAADRAERAEYVDGAAVDVAPGPDDGARSALRAEGGAAADAAPVPAAAPPRTASNAAAAPSFGPAVAFPVAPPPPRPLPEGAIDRLAELGGVRQWVWVSGAVGHGQGEGPDPAHVARDVRATLALLSRHGRVASLHVHHRAGHVVIGVDGDASLVVSGDEGVNLGAIYTTFRALEDPT